MTLLFLVRPIHRIDFKKHLYRIIYPTIHFSPWHFPAYVMHVEKKKGLILSPSKLIQRFRTLLEPLLPRYPELLSAFHDVGQYSTPKEYHVFSAWGVFDSDFKFIQSRWVTIQHPREVQLFHLFLQPTGKSGVHARST